MGDSEVNAKCQQSKGGLSAFLFFVRFATPQSMSSERIHTCFFFCVRIALSNARRNHMTSSGIDYDSNRFLNEMIFDWRRFNDDAIYKSHLVRTGVMLYSFHPLFGPVRRRWSVTVLVSEKVNVLYGISLIILYSLFHILFIRLVLQFTRIFCILLPCFSHYIESCYWL